MTGYTKITTVSISGLVICAAVYLFAVQPLLQKVSVLSENETKARVELKVLEQQILAYNTARSELSKAEDKELLYSFFVDDKNLRVPIEEMEEAAKRTGSRYQLKINRESINEESTPRRGSAGKAAEAARVTEQETLAEVPYTLSIQNTSYSQLVYFFDYLENIPHYTEISAIDLSYAEGQENAPDAINAVINGVFLVKKNETQPK